MPTTRQLFDVLRIAALWLLVASMFVGPAGLGGSWASAGGEACGILCPCHEESHDERHEAAGEPDEQADGALCSNDYCSEDDEAAPSQQGEPCGDECPDDCPNCGCYRGVAIAALSLPLISSTARSTAARMLAPVETPAVGDRKSVFRPPRSLT